MNMRTNIIPQYPKPNPTIVLGLCGLGFWIGCLVLKGTILAGKAFAEDLLEKI